MHEHLTEHVADWRNQIVIEKETRTIRNVALAGTESKNGYRYRAEALKAAVSLYENVPVFLDHPSSAVRPRDRSARDLAGSVTNVRFESGRLRGDVRTLDTDAGRTLLALAEAESPGIGMSHVVLAQRSSDGATVEQIVEVVSVDAVAFPATTKTFRESTSDQLPPQRADGPSLAGQLDRAEQTAPSSAVESSASSVRPRMSGSLEQLLASVDAELPGHLRRLAATTGIAGHGARVGVFPSYVVLEWSAAGGLPEHYLLSWRQECERLRFGNELLPIRDFQESLGAWTEFDPSTRKESTAPIQVEELQRRLLDTIAERDRLAARLDARGSGLAHCVERHRGPTSIARRTAPSRAIADELFVRTVRRR